MFPKFLGAIVTIIHVCLFTICTWYSLSWVLFYLTEAIQCCKKCKTFFIKKSEVNEGDRALLSHESTDYNSSI